MNKEEPKKAPIIMMEDNLTKAKRILITPKNLCPTGEVVYAMENKATPGEQCAKEIAKMKETLIKKIREYSNTFPKYSGESKKGQEWCAKICYHAQKYSLETVGAGEVKFVIFGAIEDSMKNRILHLEPGTIGFNIYTPAEYLEEMLCRFMNARTKEGAKEEFEHRKQGVDEDALEYYDTKLQLYLHGADEGQEVNF